MPLVWVTGNAGAGKSSIPRIPCRRAGSTVSRGRPAGRGSRPSRRSTRRREAARRRLEATCVDDRRPLSEVADAILAAAYEA
ncbi:hypothetical protein [Amycolatopsis kentuckyensis]|uniref:hypothetical protein n=1 Tax=Amycolatopsis kentuckyensis TaxID=218823 RepID=UPI003563FE45